jgi:hypothetical protein
VEVNLRDRIHQAMKPKVSKDSVNYSLGKPKEHCGICEYYASHVCQKVQGHIDPTMWCELFEKGDYA